VLQTIFITDMTLSCVIGVRPVERAKKQPLRVSVSLQAELPDVPEHDELASTVDYSALHARIAILVESSACHLMETLAHQIAEVCLSDARVVTVEVTVVKPEALAGAATAGVTIRRQREGRGMGAK
jgi:dihydroneopterin aldolase